MATTPLPSGYHSGVMVTVSEAGPWPRAVTSSAISGWPSFRAAASSAGVEELMVIDRALSATLIVFCVGKHVDSLCLDLLTDQQSREQTSGRYYPHVLEVQSVK